MEHPFLVNKNKPQSYTNNYSDELIHRSNIVMLFLVFLIPLQSVYIQRLPSLGGGLNLLNVTVILAFLGWKLRKDLNVPTETDLNKPILWFIGSLLFALVMRLFTLGDLGGHAITVKDVLIAPFLFFIVLNSVRDRAGIIKVLVATVLPLLYMFRVFYAQHANVSSWHYDHDLRISGTFSELGSNEIATFYSAFTLILMALFFFIKSTKIRVILGGFIALNLFCLVYSYSRGSYLGFLIGTLAMVWVFRKKLVLILIPAMFLFGGVAINFLPVSVQERVASISADEEGERDNSAASRFEFWGIAFDQFLKNPAVGQGYKTFIEVNPHRMDTHNYYMKLLAEQGAIGFIIFVIILWRAAKIGRSLYEESDDPLFKAIGIGFFGVVVSFAFGNIFGDRFTHYPLSAYFYVYAAIAIRALILTREKQPASEVLLKRA